MPAPSSIEVSVDDTEYSRYEVDKSTITVTVTASGGAPYSSVPIVVELMKARRSRDVSIWQNSIVLNAAIDPVSSTTTFHLPNLVDQDLINLARHGRYFVKATYEAESAEVDIGTGINGTVTVLAPPGLAGNGYFVEIVAPLVESSLGVTFSSNTLTISLATNYLGAPVPALNQAATIATMIRAFGTSPLNPSFSATYSGDGSGSIVTPAAPVGMSGGTAEVSAITPDFDIRIVTVSRFKREWLFGLNLASTQILQAKQGPINITGVSIVEISEGHPTGFNELTYSTTTSYPSPATATIGSGANGTVTVTGINAYRGNAGNSFSVQVLVPTGTSPLSATLVGNVVQVSLDVIAGVPNNAANTATLVAAAISGLTNFQGVASGSGVTPLTIAQGPTQLSGGVTVISRTLSWNGGPAVSITAPGTYILPRGSGSVASTLFGCNSTSTGLSKDYIVVKVSSLLALPTTSQSDAILLEKQQMSELTLARYLDEAIAFLENDLLCVYLEPTIVVSDREPTMIQFAAGIAAPTPIYVDPDFDVLSGPLTYYVPKNSKWIEIQTPFMGLLRVDSLFGAIANTRVIDIDLEWIHHYHKGGLIQLVPFNQASAFNYMGLIWVNALRGAMELPNFWHFTVVAGMRDTPAELIDFIGKLAAINALTALAAAFRPGLGSMSLSRDGVSQSLSFNTQAQYGIYTGAITSYKEWIKEKTPAIRANYRGATMIVM